MSANETVQNTENNEKEDELEMLQEIRFVSGSKYEGTWSAINMEGIGRYVMSNR